MQSTSEPSAVLPRIEVISYSRETHQHRVCATLAEAAALCADSACMHWIDVEGVCAAELVAEIERILPLHPMAADRLREGSARAGVEDFGPHVLATMIFIHDSQGVEVIDFIFNEHVLITVQEKPGDCFDSVRERLRLGTGRVRELGCDFLFALLGRAICESYQPILGKIDQRIVRLEDQLAARPERGHLQRIHHLRTRLMHLRQKVLPLRESISGILLQSRGEHSLRQLSLRSLFDELAALQDELDFQRDAVQRLADLYMNGVSNRLNDVMRVLTIISTIFMPLSFIASVYGMNFSNDASAWNMPELTWSYGYLYALGLMSTVATLFMISFWRRGWLGNPLKQRRHGIDGLALDMVEFVGIRPESEPGRRRRGRAPLRSSANAVIRHRVN